MIKIGLNNTLRNIDRYRHSLCLIIIDNLLFNQKILIMAEIHVQAKKGGSSTWLWILISIIVIAALAFVLIWNNRDNTQNSTSSKPNQTSYIQYHELPAA